VSLIIEFVIAGENNQEIASFDNKNDAIDYAFEYFRSIHDDRSLNQVNVKDTDNNIIFTSFRTPTTYYFSGPMT
tara:strand:+ start:4049 stop:4270 length:222 start_codon:yes stop_codon:yes gene_type:complete